MAMRKQIRDKLESLDLDMVQTGIADLWKDRSDRKHKPTQDDLVWFESRLGQINDVPTLSHGQAVLLALKRHRRSVITEFVWEPFITNNDRRCAFLGVCDGGISKDSHWMLNLSQRLPGAEFLWVPAGSEHWATPNLVEFNALCQIGRSHPSHPIDLVPRDKDGVSLLRFDFLPLPQRGQPITPQDYRLRQSWRGDLYREYETRDVEKHGGRGQYAERIDYGVFQRFRMQYLGAKIDVIRCLGGSSLATAGTILFATEMFSHPERFDDFQKRAGKIGTLTASSQIEALLKVTASVHKPMIPWEPKPEVEKVFINNSPNLVNKPKNIWTGPRLRYDDDVIDPKEDTAAVIALCRAARHDRHVRLKDLIKNREFWPNGQVRWSSAGSALSDYREMQKGVLRGIFSFSTEDPSGESAEATLLDEITIQSE